MFFEELLFDPLKRKKRQNAGRYKAVEVCRREGIARILQKNVTRVKEYEQSRRTVEQASAEREEGLCPIFNKKAAQGMADRTTHGVGVASLRGISGG